MCGGSAGSVPRRPDDRRARLSLGVHDCFAVTHPGLEQVTACELSALGLAPGVTEPGGVSFQADRRGLYAANLRLRTASRIVQRVATFHARSFAELERHAARIPWAEFVPRGAAVEFSVTSRKSRLYHGRAVAERLQRALAGVAGDSPGTEPPLVFLVRIHRDVCTVSADSSGELLHRRGYRQAVGKAPLRETLAAAMLLAAGWDGSVPLLDPLCGSGTIAIEGALIARRIAPGIARGFAFERWPSHDAGLLRDLRSEAAGAALPRSAQPILASDRDAGAIEAALANAARAGVADDVRFDRAALSAIEPPSGPGLVATNPPYGVRIGDRLRLRDLYAQLGNVLRRKCAGWELAMLSPHPDLERQAGFPFEVVAETSNGGLGVRLVRGRIPS